MRWRILLSVRWWRGVAQFLTVQFLEINKSSPVTRTQVDSGLEEHAPCVCGDETRPLRGNEIKDVIVMRWFLNWHSLSVCTQTQEKRSWCCQCVFRSEPNPQCKTAWASADHWFEDSSRPAPFSYYPSTDAPLWPLTDTARPHLYGHSQLHTNVNSNI